MCDCARVPGPATFEIDLVALEALLRRHGGSFCDCSNVTGMRSDIPAISKICRSFGAMVFVDYAASGPYTKIDCDLQGDLLDGFFVSPHKFLGGEGACGLLLLHKSVYDDDDIAERESAGRP